MASYRLTVREGPRVERTNHDKLEDAVAALGERTEELRREGGLEGISFFRDYEPSKLVKARLEISTGSFMRKREAGVDLMGDGNVIPYAGGMKRMTLPMDTFASYEEAVAFALRE